MARPLEYAIRRRVTKVRLREDQIEALQVRQDETGMTRNRLVEEAIDLFLGIKERTKRPRLKRTPVDPRIEKASNDNPARVEPKLRHVGEEHQAQSEVDHSRPTPVVPRPKTRRAPRRPL